MSRRVDAMRFAWFIDHLDPPPMQLHRHVRDAIWADQDGSGSILGSPAYSHDWRLRMESPSATITVTDMIPCYHVGREKGALCQVCVVRGADGQPIAESGQRTCERTVFRFPMLAAMARLDHRGERPGFPSFGVALRALGAARVPSRAAESLSAVYPLMGDPEKAGAHFDLALRRLQGIWRRFDPQLVA